LNTNYLTRHYAGFLQTASTSSVLNPNVLMRFHLEKKNILDLFCNLSVEDKLPKTTGKIAV